MVCGCQRLDLNIQDTVSTICRATGRADTTVPYTDAVTERLLTTEVVQQLAALAGLDLTPERAAALVPGLLPIFEGDTAITKLNLGTLSPIATPWTETPDE